MFMRTIGLQFSLTITVSDIGIRIMQPYKYELENVSFSAIDWLIDWFTFIIVFPSVTLFYILIDIELSTQQDSLRVFLSLLSMKNCQAEWFPSCQWAIFL